MLAEYEGIPNGLKLHRDGRIFVADHQHGILCFDPRTGARTLVSDRGDKGRFKGLNDLTFARTATFTSPTRASAATTTRAAPCIACDAPARPM